MKNFSTYLIVIFVLWVIMTSRSANYISLVVTNSWNVTGSNLFSGIFSGLSDATKSAGKAVGQGIGNAVTQSGSEISQAIIEAGAEGAL